MTRRVAAVAPALRANPASEPGSAAKRGHPRAPLPVRAVPLSRARVLNAALALIERGGLAKFSLRGLGAELRCEAMSIYHYFPSKTHLLDALVDHAMASVATRPPGADPIERLRAMILSYRAMAHRYPKLFQLVALHRLNTPTGVRAIDDALDLVYAVVPDNQLAAQYFRVLGYYLVGAALDETAGYAQGPSAAEPVSDEFIIAECPRLNAAAPYFKPAWWDNTFDLGVACLIDGMRTSASTLSAAKVLTRRRTVRRKR